MSQSGQTSNVCLVLVVGRRSATGNIPEVLATYSVVEIVIVSINISYNTSYIMK